MPKRSPDISGQMFGRLSAVQRVENDRHGHAQWLFNCECGKQVVIVLGSVRNGLTTSCGCFRSEAIAAKNTTHGLASREHTHPLYSTWKTMWTRCTNPNSEKYHLYGARGITICDEWKDFAQFVHDMGDKPALEYTLERCDNNGNYEPLNCKWATATEQANNRRPRHNSRNELLNAL